MKCKIIQDLLPLYCDKLTSEESNEAIEQHLHGCEECMGIYECMKTETAAVPADRNIKPLKRVKQKSRLKMLAGFAAGVLLLGTIFSFMFIGIVPASSKDVEISYDVGLFSDGNEEYLEIGFVLTTDEGRVLSMRVDEMLCTDENGANAYTITEINPYRTFQIPFTSQWGNDSTDTCYLSFNDTHHDFNENDVVTIRFRNETLTFNLGEIAAEWEMQQENLSNNIID